MGIGGGKPRNTCHTFTVQTDLGKFIALDNSIPYSYGSFDNPVIRLFPLNSLFSVKNGIEGKYWVLPLINFISEFSQHHLDLDRHPLRIFPNPVVPDGLSENEALTALLNANSRNRLIVFITEDGNPGFIEPLQDFNVRKDKLLKGEENGLVTAIMVGNLSSTSVDFKDLRGWAPFEFLRLLSLATGSEIGASWIEFRDEQGRLVQRFHSRLEQNQFYTGYRVIDETINIGIGNLLTQAQKSPDFGRSYLRVIIKHLVRSGYEILTLEDKLAYLFRGLDGLCNEYGLTEPLNLNEILSEECVSAVDDVITKTSEAIRDIAKNAELTKEETERAILGRIADQITQAKIVRKGFSWNVVALSRNFELPDPDIINEWYKLNPRSDNKKRWEDVLSYYRGIIMHRGFFDFDIGGQDLWDVVRITNHLHDILIRILFKILRYEGTYRPNVFDYLTEKPVDWVKGDTPAFDLGY